MASVQLTASEIAVVDLVGTRLFLDARARAGRGEVKIDMFDPREGVVRARMRDTGIEHVVDMGMLRLGSGLSVSHDCTCELDGVCLHAAAILLKVLPAVMGEPPAEPKGKPKKAKAPKVPVWERAVQALAEPPVAPGPKALPRTSVGVQLEFQTAAVASGPRGKARPRLRLALYPVQSPEPGRWLRSCITWSQLEYLEYRGHTISEHHLGLLEELRYLADEHAVRDYWNRGNALYLDAVRSRRLWDVLREAQETGLPLMQKDKAPVVLHETAATVTMQVGRDNSGIALRHSLVVDGDDQGAVEVVPIGSTVHGIAWRAKAAPDGRRTPARPMHLAAVAREFDVGLLDLLDTTPITVPERDEQRFLQQYVPSLTRRLPVVAADASVVLPETAPPVLCLTVRHGDKHRAHVSWRWLYGFGDQRRSLPLRAWFGERESRDPDAEKQVLATVTSVVAALPALYLGDGANGAQAQNDSDAAAGLALSGPRPLAETTVLDGVATARLVHDIVPLLRALPHLEVVLEGEVPDYRDVADAPVITFGEIEGATAASSSDRDWFDLSVKVSVGGEGVPFHLLFSALALGDQHLLLPSGAFFSLAREEFQRLAAVIQEARGLQDHPKDGVRLSRYQADLWAELERLGVVDGQAAAWQQQVRALTEAGEMPQYPVPEGLQATLRPYQLEGFRWLCALHERGLGGLLADDMGLGKTVQALAFVQHLHEQPNAPFLVVAPTSLVGNWASEAARFTPGLRVATVVETERRRGMPLKEVVDGAHVVVTSYTLFRLEFEQYQALEWSGLMLDEAQFAKNHQAGNHRYAKELSAPFKVAITGTPMENNLMELWSLLSITAPGLFPTPTRFAEYYRAPIEREGNTERLAQLRKRVRPLMLRRTKELVAADLPAKQEQVLELDLDPKHRRLYDTYLQRERQKVLGLLDDMNKNRFEIFRSLTLLRQAALDISLIDPDGAPVPSTKLDALGTLVDDIVGEGHRVIVFSQFTRFLSSARERVTAAGHESCYLDGGTRDRPAVIERFRSGQAPVFFISLKAGGFGLNLTEADYCILLDPWWNPATEAQAVDRIHRLGQTRSVMVYRLVAKNTIEDKVMALKAGKAALFSSVMDGGGFEKASLSASDIRDLLE